MTMVDDSWKTYSSALRRLDAQPDLLERFQQDIEGTTAARLGLSPEMVADLKNLYITAHGRTPAGQPSPILLAEESEHPFSAEQFFKETYGQLKRGALATTIMSSLIFVVGLALLVIAAIQSIRGSATDVAIVLASSGLVSIAAAFYRSPVTQIRLVAADVQQSSMVLMSYMLGLSLLSKSLSGQETTADRQALASLTGELIGLLPGRRGADQG